MNFLCQPEHPSRKQIKEAFIFFDLDAKLRNYSNIKNQQSQVASWETTVMFPTML